MNPSRRALSAPTDRDRGSSPVEFVLVGGLLTLLTFGVLQLGLSVYVRNVVHDAAVEGAYHAALADRTTADGTARTRQVISRAVGVSYAQDVKAEEVTVRGARVVRVTVTAALPLVGLLGMPRSLEVSADAPAESMD